MGTSLPLLQSQGGEDPKTGTGPLHSKGPVPVFGSGSPVVPLAHLDDLWFQVAGTVCNLTCNHCFISCSPHNHSFSFLDLETVRQALDESVRLGVKEYYFTSREPVLHHDIVAILELALKYDGGVVVGKPIESGRK